MAKVAYFEIHADDPRRASEFYSQVFGWTFEQVLVPGMEYWTLKTRPDGPVEGGLLRRVGARPQALQPINAFCAIVEVDDMAATVAKIMAQGGQVGVPPFPVVGVGFRAFINDSEGNILGLLQPFIKAS